MGRLYDLLALMLPEALRRDHGDQMRRMAADLWADRRRRGILRVLVALVLDVLVNAVRQRRPTGWTSRRSAAGPGASTFSREPRPPRVPRSRRDTDPSRTVDAPRDTAPISLRHAPRRRGHMDTLLHDLRHAARGLRRSPGFALLATLILTLGIGANVAIFSVVDAVLLAPLPYEDPGRLAVLADTYNGNAINTSYPNLVDWRERASSFSGITGFDDRKVFQLTDGDTPLEVYGASATADFFDVLGVEPVLGRGFRPEDDRPGADPVVVLGERLWRQNWGADPDLVGRDIRMNGRLYTVVGIAPATLRIPEREELWVPLATHSYGDERLEARNTHFLESIGRLAPGATLEEARAEMQAIGAALAEAHPEQNSGVGATVMETLRDNVVGGLEPALRLLLAAVSLVVLIAAANVAGLTLARASGRARSIAVRRALGASRHRVIRLHLAEAALVAGVGTLGGVVLSLWLVPLILGLDPGALPSHARVGVDGPVLAWAAGLAATATLLAGVLPALSSGTRDLVASLREGDAGSAEHPGRRRARSALVVAEVALAVMLVAGAGLLVRSFRDIVAEEPGFRTDRLLTARLSLSSSAYDPDERRVAFVDRLLERLRALPGVESVGISSRLPLTEGTSTTSFYVEGLGDVPSNEWPAGHVRYVAGDVFDTLGIPVLRGRALRDREPEPVFVVDEELAERVWSDEEALGKRARPGGPDTPWFRVVGVVGRTRHWGQRFAPTPTLYVPYELAPEPGFMVALRSRGDPAELAPALRGAVWDLDPNLPVSDVQSMERLLAGSLAVPRFNLALLGSFALLALALGAVGLYGVVSHSVARRRHEIGVRMALGARGREVVGLVARQGLSLAVLGVALGIPAYWAVSDFMADMLVGVEPTDVPTLAAVALLLLAVALVASVVPARRATRVDPVTTLRQE